MKKELYLSLLLFAVFFKFSNAQTGLPAWPLAVGGSSAGNAQVVDWRDMPPTVSDIPNTAPSNHGGVGAAYDECGNLAFYVLHTGLTGATSNWQNDHNLFVYAPDGTSLIDNNVNSPGLNGVRGDREVQVVPVPGVADEWYIIYNQWNTDIGAIGSNGSYTPSHILYSRVHFTPPNNMTVIDRDVLLPANGVAETYTLGKAVSRTAVNPGEHYLFACRRSEDNDFLSLDRFVISGSGITYEANTGDVPATWWNQTVVGSPIELSPDEQTIAVVNRNQNWNRNDIFLFNAAAFDNVDYIPISAGDLMLLPDNNVISTAGTVSSFGNDDDGPLEFLKNFEKKIAYIEFSPNGNFLYIGSGGFYLGGYTNLTYLGQIDLTASPLELRLQIQITDAYDDVEGYGYTFSNASDASYLAWHGISDIQSSYDGNLYFTKLNSNTLFVIPDPDSYMPQMLVPGTVDLSTQAEPNISVNGDVLLLPDQIDGYEYITGEHCLCGEVIEESLTYACAPQGSYSYSFSLQNVSPEFTVTSVALLNVEPADIDIQAVLPNGGTTSPFWNLNSSAPFNLPPMQPNGGTTGPLEALITPGSPITEPTDVCFEVVYYNSTYECCRYEHCITLEPIDPCQYVSVSQAGELETEDCCYDLALTNEYCPDFFTGIIIESITDGVVFTGEDGGNTWTTTVENGGKQIHWQPTSGAIPMGETGDMHFCLEGIHSTAQMPQEVLIHWLAIDPDSGEEEIICTQKELFNCQPCMSFTIDDDILCNPDGTFTVGFTVTNMADGHTAEYLILESNTANLLFDPALQWLDGLEPGESYDGSFTVYDFNNTPLAPGTEISFKAMLDDGEGWCCHFDGLTFEVPDCGQGGGCACGTQEEFSAAVNAGFTADVDCNNGQINVMANNLGPCDDVEFALFLPSQVFVESSAGAGDETVTLPKPVDGPYLIVMSVLRYDEAGNLCYESAMSQEIYVLCNPCECGTMGEFVNDVNAGFTFNEICFDGLFVLDANALDPCDQVIWNVYGPDGTLVASQDLFGQQPAYFSVPPDGVYTVEMAVTRIDNSGDPCFPNRTFEDDIVINCLPPQSSSLAAVISTARPDAQPNSGMGGSRDLTRSGRPQASTGYINGDAGEARLVNEPGSAPHQPLLLYPNPAASQVNVIVTEAGFYQIQAFDRYGRAVKQWQRQLDAHEKLNLNVQELPAGLYLLQLQDERGKVESGKFVKM